MSVATSAAPEGLDEPRSTFSGSAAAMGVQVAMTVPGAPATDTPLDSGGPTAQATVDSTGSSSAYAAFPDPGQLIVTLPGVAVGVFEGGAGGLPPVDLPSPPAYPFYVTSDNANPENSVGSGPMMLSAKSDEVSSVAEASTGFRQSVAGNAALALATASVAPTDDGSVVAQGVSELQGLGIGPFSIGSIRSSATQTLDRSGRITRQTDLAVSGMSIGGIPIEVDDAGLDIAGQRAPLPINSTMQQLLASSGITVEVLAPEEFEDRILAPALVISFPFSMPFAVPNVGQFSGTVTVTVGRAMASMVGFTPDGGLDRPTDFTPPAPLGSPAVPSVGLSSGAAVPPRVGSGAATPAPVAPATQTAGTADAVLEPTAALSPEALLGIQSVYLVVAAVSLLAAGGGQLIHRLGGRTA